MFRTSILAGLAFVMLTACSGNDTLHNLDSGAVGPDEFSVMPSLPLVMPDTTSLPPPTPGGANRSDQNPTGDAIAALGGSQAAIVAGGIPASDTALLAFVGRNGVDPAIRSTLSQEDAAFRQGARIGGLFNFLGRDRYYPAYAGQALDAYAELDRFEGTGTEVPTAPPEN